jgi:hypothetical protein
LGLFQGLRLFDASCARAKGIEIERQRGPDGRVVNRTGQDAGTRGGTADAGGDADLRVIASACGGHGCARLLKRRLRARQGGTALQSESDERVESRRSERVPPHR